MKLKSKISLLLIASIVTVFTVMTLNAEQMSKPANSAQSSDMAMGLQVATFAGGCFWCTEAGFEKLPGVSDAVSGYAGGHVDNPSYEQVSMGKTGHTEVVQVFYDPATISYSELLESFWRQFDPTDGDGSFVDRGNQYRPAIYYHNDEQKMLAETGIKKLAASGRYDKPIAVEVTALDVFYKAETYHQDYYKRNPIRYKYYRFNSGRDQYLEKTWGEDLKLVVSPKKGTSVSSDKTQKMSMNKYSKPDDTVLKQRLTDMQYRVTQHEGTEPPFKNAYNDNKKAGIYVDIVSGEPLFSSTHKFDSGTGWPSFDRPINSKNVKEETDYKMIFPRTEVRSASADSHLGHVFDDGPKKTTGLRYCINSAALNFISKEQLEEKGYGEYLQLFSKK